MSIIGRNVVRAALIVSILGGYALAQDSVPEKHVKDIKAEQTQESLLASALCQRVKTDGQAYTHLRPVDPATLQPNLAALMKKSDEVVLASIFLAHTDTVSSSGEDAIQFFDVRVLRTWKGAHRVDDLLTFAVPSGSVTCEPDPGHNGQFLGASTMTGGVDWKGIGSLGPYVLFLRQSQGDEGRLIPGLRLTGGDGAQGLFALQSDPGGAADRDCSGIAPANTAKCNADLDSNQTPVSVTYRRDPLLKKYDGMPIANFLREVQFVADSLGYSADSAN
ncbi:MAG: hypothetical protein WCC04_13285 [Terriglobales bacterium]